MDRDASPGEERGEPDEGSDRCDFCRMPMPLEPVEITVDGSDYECCSEACRDALVASEYVFTEYHGHRRVKPGVSAMDASLPQGFPRNAFVLVSGQPGVRDRAVGAEIVWRTLERGEPVVFVTFQEPPGSIVQQFLTLEWNVLPYLENGLFHIVDCFTYRVADRDRMYDRMDEWNKHLNSVAKQATTTIRDPSDLGEVQNKLDNAMEAREMIDTGMVIIDSLTELGTLVQPVQAYNFVKDVRADICKGRFVPIFAGATLAGDPDAFPHDLVYVVDGLIELRLTDELVPDTLLKQARIRKLNGVLVIPEWHTYEYTAGTGMVLFDPEEEMEKREAELEDADGAETEESTAEAAEEADEPDDATDDTAGERPEPGADADTNSEAPSDEPADDSPADADDAVGPGRETR
ncbi:RAD55 family ATPase [Natronomonas sp. EA1]|uniref:RAD55 family ATPase n=1 Tax=Natronomonas sp. EA1 TaxID=3421655 RepID=UPI003EB9CB86